MGIKIPDAQTIFRKKSFYGTYTAHNELKDTLRIHWYSTGPTIYNWNPMFQHWNTMALGSGQLFIFRVDKHLNQIWIYNLTEDCGTFCGFFNKKENARIFGILQLWNSSVNFVATYSLVRGSVFYDPLMNYVSYIARYYVKNSSCTCGV